jgi:PDZ and LIM domain protein 5/6/7
LKEHGVLGYVLVIYDLYVITLISHIYLSVNFNKMMPKSGVFKQSEVFQVLNEQQLKAKAAEEEEAKAQQPWTTFLQKPNRPSPVPRNQQIITSTYKPLIVKQPKPKCAPDYRITPSPEPVQISTYQTQELIVTESKREEWQQSEIIVERKDEDGSAEQEIVQVQEQVEIETCTAEISSETVITTETTTTETVTFEELAAEATGEPVNEELITEEIKSQEDEVSVLSSAFAEQLANVQCQLMALSHLPKTIQSTLDDITKQLQSLIPTQKLKQKSVESECKAVDASVTREGDE